MALRSSHTDLMREREKAQRERAKLKEQSKEKALPFPMFPPPRRTTEQDDRIEQVLGHHSEIFNTRDTSTHELLGVISQPQTPLPSHRPKDDIFTSHKKPGHPKNGMRPNSSMPNLHGKPPSSKPSMPEPNTSYSTSNSFSKLPKSKLSYSELSKSATLNNVQIKKDKGERDFSATSKTKTLTSNSKSPVSSSVIHDSSQVKKEPSPKPSPEKPLPLGNSKQFTPPNGINRPPRKNLEKLRIPSGQNDGQKEPQSVDEIFKEMTHLEHPLTAISTPQKDEHFPFPYNIIGRNQSDLKSNHTRPSKRSSSSDEDKDCLNISLLKPIEPLITPPETPIKPPPVPVKTEKADDVSKDLTVSDSEDEDNSKIPDDPSRKDPQKGKRAPVKEPRTSMSSDSSSSESGNESESSSDESNSSSEDEEEEEKTKVKLEKVTHKSPVQEKNSGSLSWSLNNFVPGDKSARPASNGSDNYDENAILLESVVKDLIKSPTSKTPTSIEKSPYQQPHSHSSSHGDSSFRRSSPHSIPSTPSKSFLNGITPSKKNLHSDNSDSEIDVVNTPQKKVLLPPQSEHSVVKRLDYENKREVQPRTAKRQSSELSFIGSLSSDDDNDDEDAGPHNNNDVELNDIQKILEHVGTKLPPVSPLHRDKSPEKIPKKLRRARTPVNKDALKYNDGKPSIKVCLSLKSVAHFLKDERKKSPYRDKVANKSVDVKQNSPYPNLPSKSPAIVHKSPFHDVTANTEPVEMDLDTDSEMVNGHIEDYSSRNVSSITSPHNNKCWKPCDTKIGSKRKENEPEKVFIKRRKITPKTNKSTETAQKERDSHEDDHKWDRKHPHRSSQTREPLSNSSTSSSHTDKPEFELVEDLNGQANSDAHPSSVETIFNREGDGEITHDPISRKPIRKLDDPLEHNDVYRARARDLKHQADEIAKHLKRQVDSFSDRIAMYLLYTESMTMFILCACAMEKEERKPADINRMYSDTLNLISHICRIRPTPETSDTEKKLAVLIFRIQSILCYKLYKLKKNEALKFKKIIDEHNKSLQRPRRLIHYIKHPCLNKSSSSKPAHAPSPHWNNRSTPSPMSPSPSPAGSVCSQGSQGSADFTPSKMMNGNISSQPTMSSPGTVAVPQRIHSITQQYLSIVGYSVQCHEYWDQADLVLSDLKDFYEDIDEQCGSLSIHSSVPDLVYYVQTGLQKIKDTS